jgi:hypothetical protein
MAGKKGRSRAPRREVSKHMLLPLPTHCADELSLAGHMTLAACGAGAGSRQLLYELIRITYLSYYFWEAGYGEVDYQFYCSAEAVLEKVSGHAKGTTTWTLCEESFEKLKTVIQVYDGQIGEVTGSVFKTCKLKVDHLLHVQIPTRAATAKPETRYG